MEDNEIPNSEDVREHVERYGLSGINEFFRRKLEKWKDVEITIGVTGDAGVGKSSLINAITGARVAKTGVTDTTKEPAEYTHPKNEKVKLWDLPGIGTPNCPDLKTFCEKVDLESYDTFLILSASRFTENNLQVAKKVKSIQKSFFFVRTKIDHDIEDQQFDYNEKTEESILTEIRKDCQENLKSLAACKKNVFLISNHYKEKWDFYCLRQAILDALEPHQRESLILTLTSDSQDVIKQKVKILQGRSWMVASASAAVATVPVPGLSAATDLTLITRELNFYKSQIPFPEEDSEEFRRLTPEMRHQMSKLCVTSAVQIGNLLATYAARSAGEEYARFIPLVGSAIAGSISFGSTYIFLDKWLNELEEISLKFLDETSTRVAEN